MGIHLCALAQKSRQRPVDTWSPKLWTTERKSIGDKEADRREHGVHWICVYVPAHAGFIWRRVVGGVKVWKQVPIVQLGVTSEVMRVRVSRVGPQLGLRRATEPAGDTGRKKYNFQNYHMGTHYGSSGNIRISYSECVRFWQLLKSCKI